MVVKSHQEQFINKEYVLIKLLTNADGMEMLTR